MLACQRAMRLCTMTLVDLAAQLAKLSIYRNEETSDAREAFSPRHIQLPDFLFPRLAFTL